MTDLTPEVADYLADETALAQEMFYIIDRDQERLQLLDDYHEGRQADPYMPPTADAEYKLLSERCISNSMPLLVNTPAQSLYVDGLRKGSVEIGLRGETAAPEWEHWQRSRLDARQAAVYRAAFIYGHSFVVTEHTPKGIVSRGLSPRLTAAYYADPANDNDPLAALTVIKNPHNGQLGRAAMWGETEWYTVLFEGGLHSGRSVVQIIPEGPHGATQCPVTRFAASVDLEGRTMGVIEPMIKLQDRINQTVFDLLVAQTYASIKVRTIAGMAPQVRMKEDPSNPGGPWIPDLDVQGRIQPEPIQHNASRFMVAPDKDTKFGTLDETPLDGFINSIDMSIRHFSALSQTPPHYLLGQIANLSAEALQAAEVSLSRKIEEFRHLFGESWERVFRVAAEMAGDTAAAMDYSSEVMWRDMGQHSLAQAADALLKLKEIGVPDVGLWDRIPGVTQNETDYWKEILQSSDPVEKEILARERARAAITASQTVKPIVGYPPTSGDGSVQ